jgi:hypothetical protein
VAAWNDATDDDRACLFEDVGWGKLPASFRNKSPLPCTKRSPRVKAMPEFQNAQQAAPAGVTRRSRARSRYLGIEVDDALAVAEQGVVVLCIMPESDGKSEREAERRAELNTVYWASEDHRFLLLGPVSAETMEKMAEVVRSRFAS